MKKIWITAMMALLPVTAGAEVYTLPGVVVTAEKHREKQEDFLSGDVITGKDMERMGASNVAEALGMTQGLELTSGLQSAMGGHQLMLRGMNSNQTLLLVDGHRLADEDTSATRNMMILNRLNLSGVDSIAVTRGADSALYGSSAMGGVIDIQTKKPGSGESLAGFLTGSRENSLYFRTDSGKEGRFHLAVDGRITKDRARSFYRDSWLNGVHDLGWDIPSYGIRRYAGLDGLYDFENSSKNTLRMKLNYFDEGQTTRFADAFTSYAVLEDNASRTSRRLWDTSLTYEGETERNQYNGQVYYSRLRKKYNDTWMVLPMRAAASDRDRALYETWGVEGKDILTLGSHQMTWGGEWRKDTYTGTRLTLSDDSDRKETGREQHSGAFYASDKWRINSRLSFLSSMRFDRESSYGFIGIPAAGLVYQVNDHMKWKINYGKGFRAPSLSERYIHMKYSSRMQIDGNPDLNAETSHNLDTGLEWQTGKTGWKLSWFDQKVKNLIDYEEIGRNSGRYIYVNRSRAEIKGIEGEITHTLSPHWNIKGTYTYLDGRDISENDRLSNRSRHTVSLGLSYEGENPYGYTGMLWSTFKKDFYFEDKNYTWNEINVSLQKQWGKEYTFTLGLYNLLDRRVNELYVDGRAWFTGLEIHW